MSTCAGEFVSVVYQFVRGFSVSVEDVEFLSVAELASWGSEGLGACDGVALPHFGELDTCEH